MSSSWQEVTAAAVCPICGKNRRCKIAPDVDAARCFRVSEAPAGWRIGKTHPDGGATFHRLDAAASAPRSKAPRSSPKSRAADSLGSTRLHEAYSMLLSASHLNVLSRLNLHKRGLPDEEIDRR